MLKLASALFLSVICLPGTAFAQDAAEKQVIAADDAWIAAENGGDDLALRDILDDKFVATFDAGKPLDKQNFTTLIIEAARDRSRKQVVSGRSVAVEGDTAIVVGDDLLSCIDDGKLLRCRCASPRPISVGRVGGRHSRCISLPLGPIDRTLM